MNKIRELVRKNIIDMEAYSSAREEFKGTDSILLDANENPFGNLNRYPDPMQKELKKSLGKQISINKENLIITNGSDELLDLVFRVFCEPKENKVLTFFPSYGMYKVLSDINNIELIEEHLDKNFDIDLSRLELFLPDPKLKLIIICNPNNPTGNLFSLKKIEYILKNYKGIVLIDEAYIDYSPTNSCISLLKKYENLIVCRTMSKAWGIASARIGFAASSTEIIGFLNRIKAPYNVSSPNQQEALKRIMQIDKVEKHIKTILKEKKKVIKSLEKLSFVVKVFTSETNFILVKFNDPLKVYNHLIENQVVVRNRTSQVKDCLRITIGSATENKKLIQNLKKI